MKREFLVMAVAVSFAYSIGNAAPAAKSPLAAALQGLQKEGFYGAAAVAVPQAPSTPNGVASQSSEDHTKTVLAAYAQQALASTVVGGSLSGAVSRRLGFAPTASTPWVSDPKAGEMMPIKGITREKASTGESKTLFATAVRGATEIILVYEKKGVELRAYLVGMDGSLKAAVAETPSGVSDIFSAQAQSECAAEIGFWVRYYDKTHASGS